MRTHYQVLGVPDLPAGRQGSASLQEIKTAYRGIASKNHPDYNPDPKAHSFFSEAAKAYAVLSDSEKRRKYDEEISNALVDNPLEVSRELWNTFLKST